MIGSFNLPVLMSGYGAHEIAGFHVSDRPDFMVGGHVWNFADFATYFLRGRWREDRSVR